MTDRDTQWITVQEAAALAGCSTKTLYRYMAKGLVQYRKAANNRRYLRTNEVLSAIEKGDSDIGRELDDLRKTMVQLQTAFQQQSHLIEQMIRLHHPQSFRAMLQKHRAKRPAEGEDG